MRARIGICVVAIAALVGCIRSWSEVHIFEEGFSGPVVVVYGVSGAPPAAKDAAGGFVLVIPRSGIVMVADLSPGSGAVNLNYYVQTPDGARRKIPSHTGSRDEFQVFAEVVGSTGNSGSDPTDWQAYVVGRPNDWPSAASDRQALVERVVGDLRARAE